MMWQQRSQGLESGIDALHTASLVAVGDFSPHSLLLLHVAARRETADVVVDTVAVAQRNVLTSNPSAGTDVTLGLLLLLRLLRCVYDRGDRHRGGHRAVVNCLNVPATYNIRQIKCLYVILWDLLIFCRGKIA